MNIADDDEDEDTVWWEDSRLTQVNTASLRMAIEDLSKLLTTVRPYRFQAVIRDAVKDYAKTAIIEVSHGKFLISHEFPSDDDEPPISFEIEEVFMKELRMNTGSNEIVTLNLNNEDDRNVFDSWSKTRDVLAKILERIDQQLMAITPPS